MSRTKLGIAVAALLLTSVVAMAGAPIVVDQIHRSFSKPDLRVSRGQTVRFNNVDEFLHQIYIDNPAFKISSDEQKPGQSVDITFPVKGTFEVRCEIHPKMLMSVTVD